MSGIDYDALDRIIINENLGIDIFFFHSKNIRVGKIRRNKLCNHIHRSLVQDANAAFVEGETLSDVFRYLPDSFSNDGRPYHFLKPGSANSAAENPADEWIMVPGNNIRILRNPSEGGVLMQARYGTNVVTSKAARTFREIYEEFNKIVWNPGLLEEIRRRYNPLIL